MATLTALAAMSIDTVLPALPAIGASLAVERANDNQLVVSLFFLGFGVGQLFYGPLSDAAGRKPAAYVGLALFIAGSLLALLSRSVPDDARRQGCCKALAWPGRARSPSHSIRDKFEGRAMARVMSLVMFVFILVPVVAPAIGQTILGRVRDGGHLRRLPGDRCCSRPCGSACVRKKRCRAAAASRFRAADGGGSARSRDQSTSPSASPSRRDSCSARLSDT